MAKPNKDQKSDQKSDQKKKIPPKIGWKRQPFFRHLIAIGLIAGVALVGLLQYFSCPIPF